MDIIVPVFNERQLIQAKLDNLRHLDYPAARLRVTIVSGPSTDGTTELLSAALHEHGRFELLQTSCADKGAQLNAALDQARGEWVLVTDCDARLEVDTLRVLVKAALEQPALAAVGPAVQPVDAHPLEELHWRLLNGLREREARQLGGTILTGPCYLFRRSVVPLLPIDVVADDFYVALSVMTAGKRVGFTRAEVAELRTPSSVRELFWHKERKARALLRELIRFRPGVGAMSGGARPLLYWRWVQLVVAPLSLMIGGGALITYLAASVGMLSVGLALLGAPLGFAVVTAIPFARTLSQVIKLFLLLVGVLLVALLRYPFAPLGGGFGRLTAARTSLVLEGDKFEAA